MRLALCKVLNLPVSKKVTVSQENVSVRYEGHCKVLKVTVRYWRLLCGTEGSKEHRTALPIKKTNGIFFFEN